VNPSTVNRSCELDWPKRDLPIPPLRRRARPTRAAGRVARRREQFRGASASRTDQHQARGSGAGRDHVEHRGMKPVSLAAPARSQAANRTHRVCTPRSLDRDHRGFSEGRSARLFPMVDIDGFLSDCQDRPAQSPSLARDPPTCWRGPCPALMLSPRRSTRPRAGITPAAPLRPTSQVINAGVGRRACRSSRHDHRMWGRDLASTPVQEDNSFLPAHRPRRAHPRRVGRQGTGARRLVVLGDDTITRSPIRPAG